MSATAKTKISDPLVLFCAYALLFLPAIDGFAGLAFQFGRNIELNSVIGRQAEGHTHSSGGGGRRGPPIPSRC